MVFKKWKLTAVLLSAGMMLAMCGCEKKVISVSTVSEEEGQETEYIEMQELELKEKERENGREDIKYCAVMIPAGYHESEEIPGMYLHERTPLDSSNIYYSVSEGSSEGFLSSDLTEEEYRETIENALNENGQEGSLTIDSFEEIDMDGIPAYKVRTTYETDENSIQQLTYLVLAEDTYTITYSQSEDDELMADFEISDGTIKLVKEESVQTASTEKK
ncbi:MAG: hypothetical protein ACI4ER_03345 [Suilimivivens sp.]